MAAAIHPVISDHDLLQKIGRGSYGEVWLARNALGTLRAVKIVRRTDFDNDRPYIREFSGIEKFEPISRSHEGFVDILQVGRNEAESFFYYVMELADPAAAVPGFNPELHPFTPRTLASDLKAHGRLKVIDALAIFLNLTRALGHLHAGGLLHRDIKPANVIFVGGIAKLADIGLVAEAGGPRTFVGTEGFIPPEGPGTVSADLYALGKLMYEVVTGRDRNEFPALALDRSDLEETAALVEFNAILLRCCEPDPAKRYRRAADLQSDLVLLQSGHSVQRLHSFERRLRLARVAGLIAVGVAALAMLGIFGAHRQERIAEENFQRSEKLRVRAENAERRANEELYAALLARAAAERRSGLVGARDRTLAAIRQAGAMGAATADLRSEAISALALTDFSESHRWPAAVEQGLQTQYLEPGGTFRAQAVAGGAIEFRDTGDERLIASLPGNSSGVDWIGPFSPDSRWLRVVGVDGHHLIWDVASRKLSRDIESRPALKSEFIPGTTRLLAWSENSARIENLAGGGSRAITLPMAADTASIAPSREVAALARWNTNRVVIYDLAHEAIEQELRLATNLGVTTCSWSPDGHELALATTDHRVMIFNLGETNSAPRILSGHGAEIVSLAWSPGGEMLLSSSWDGTTRIWSLREAHEIARHLVQTRIHGFTRDGAHISLFEATSRNLVLWDVHFETISRTLPEPGPDTIKSPYRTVFTPDSAWLFTGTHDGIRAYHVPDGRPEPLLAEPRVIDLIQLRGPSHLFVAESRRGLLISGWQTNKTGGIDFSPLSPVAPEDLPRLHSLHEPWLGDLREGLRVFYQDRPPLDLPGGSNSLYSELSPNGQFAAASVLPGQAILWSLTQPVRKFDFDRARSYGIAFSPDSRRMYYASLNELWCIDTATASPAWHVALNDSPSPHPNTAIRTSADGRFVAAVMRPFDISLVEAKTGRLLATFQHPGLQSINDVEFSPDGAWLAMGCNTHVTLLWDLRRIHQELAAMKIDW